MQPTELYDAALSLPYEARLDLATRLWESLQAPSGVLCEDDPGFAEEIRIRSESADAGEFADITADEVIERLRNKKSAKE